MKKILFVFLPLFIITVFVHSVLAKGPSLQKDTIAPKDTGGVVKLCNPLVGNCAAADQSGPDPQQLIGKIINAVLGIVGSLALIMFIYGGFTWMLAAGNAEKVKKGKDIIIWATIGLIVIFSAYALVKFVISGIEG